MIIFILHENSDKFKTDTVIRILLEAFEKWLEGRERVPVIAIPVSFTADDVADTVGLATY